MLKKSPRLCIDFGTSNTVATLRYPDGRTKMVLFDGSESMPSCVFLNTEGELLTGRIAANTARLRPECYEPHPKRRIGDGMLLLGDHELAITDVIAAVLRRVMAEATRMNGSQPITDVTLTHPQDWWRQRRQQLVAAANQAGIANPVLLSEPLAAMHYLAAHMPDLAPDDVVLLYDFGGGTLDVTVVRFLRNGMFEVLASEGLHDVGGVDIDAALVEELGIVYAEKYQDEWPQLMQPFTPAERRASLTMWESVRTAKEDLAGSSNAYADILDKDVLINRETLDRRARPIIDRTIACAKVALAVAGINPQVLAKILLVGGASRLPLAATMLHQQFGVPPTVFGRCQTVVAEGGVLYAPPQEATAFVVPQQTQSESWPALGPQPEVEQPTSDEIDGSDADEDDDDEEEPADAPGEMPPHHTPWRRHITVAAAILVVAIVLAGVLIQFSPKLWQKPPQDAPYTGATLQGHDDTVSLAFSYDENKVASVGADGAVRLSDVNGNLLWRAQPKPGIKHVLFSPRNNQLFVSGDSGMHVLDAGTGKVLRELVASTAGRLVECLRIDNTVAVIVGTTAQLFHVDEYRKVHEASESAPVTDIACQATAFGNLAIAAGSTISLWNPRVAGNPPIKTDTISLPSPVERIWFGGDYKYDGDSLFAWAASGLYRHDSGSPEADKEERDMDYYGKIVCMASAEYASFLALCTKTGMLFVDKVTMKDTTYTSDAATTLAVSETGARIALGFNGPEPVQVRVL